MFSLRQLLQEVKRLGCPNPIAHVRWLRGFAARNGGMTWIQSLYACHQSEYRTEHCSVPESVVQELGRKLGLAR